MPFQIKPLSSSLFEKLYGKTDEELARLGAKPYIADQKPGFPCRVTLSDAEPGERLILLNFTHQACSTPYRSSHAIFVIDGAEEKWPSTDEVPQSISSRLISVRAFNAEDMMTSAEIIEGQHAAAYINEVLINRSIQYLHLHYAKPGCYAAKAERSYET